MNSIQSKNIKFMNSLESDFQTKKMRRSERLKSQRIKEFLPYAKEPFLDRIKNVVTQCQIPYCGCKNTSSVVNDKDIVNVMYHGCPVRHHQKCQKLHR